MTAAGSTLGQHPRTDPNPEVDVTSRRRRRRVLAWVSPVLATLIGMGLVIEIARYRPLHPGSSTIDLDVKTIGDGIGDTRMVVPYQAGRAFTYATSVENTGSRAVTLTGAVVTTNPPGTPSEVRLDGPDGRPSGCELQVCLASAAWAHGPYGRGADRALPLVGPDAAWHPFGEVRLAPGASVMVRLTFLFNSCGQDNEGWVTVQGWTATFNYFGRHTQFQPFRLPLTVTPLPAAQRHLPPACPKPAS